MFPRRNERPPAGGAQTRRKGPRRVHFFDWSSKRVLITSGPTREFLDPIRFLTNAASGRMGWALAKRARTLGADVVVVSGPCALAPLRRVRTVPVVSALEMRREVLKRVRACHVVIGAAAVSDWRLKRPAAHKIKRSKRLLRLTLSPNPDIIKEAASRRRPGAVVVGFALETRRRLAAARAKLERKGLDLIVANGPGTLGSDRAELTLVWRGGRAARLGPLTKDAAARAVLGAVEEILESRAS